MNRFRNLAEQEMKSAMELILSEGATTAQIVSLITALRIKGESVDEIAGAAKAIRAVTNKIQTPSPLINIDRDEISISGATRVSELKEGQIRTFKKNPLIGLSKPGAKHPVPPATKGALRAPVFYRLWR